MLLHDSRMLGRWPVQVRGQLQGFFGEGHIVHGYPIRLEGEKKNIAVKIRFDLLSIATVASSPHKLKVLTKYYFPLYMSKHFSKCIYCQLRTWEPEGRYHYSKMFCREPEGRYQICKVYGDSALLVLNGTSLNVDSALLALSWRYNQLRIRRVLILHKFYRAKSFVTLNRWCMYYVTTLIRSNTIIRSILPISMVISTAFDQTDEKIDNFLNNFTFTSCSDNARR